MTRIPLHKFQLIFCCILLTIGASSVAQQLTQTKVDSILEAANKMDENLDAVKLLTVDAGKKMYPEITKKLIDRAVFISENQEDPKMLSNAYYAKGNYHFFNAELDSATIYLDKALLSINDESDLLLKSGIMSTKGGIASKKDNIAQSIFYTLQAKEILDQMDTISLSKEDRFKQLGKYLVISNSLANLYNKTEDYEEAIPYYDFAKETALSLKNFYGAAIITSNKGNLLLKMEQYHEALKTLKKSKELKLNAGAPETSIGISILNIAIAYDKLNQDEEALTSYNEAIVIFEKYNYIPGTGEALPYRGKLYIKKGQTEEAIKDCGKAKEIIQEAGISELYSEACQCLYEAYKAKGMYEKALVNFESYTVAKDSVLNKKNIKRITQIEMQYEFNKKKQEQEKILQKEKELKKNILIGSIIIGVFLLTIIFFLRKRIQYKNKLAQQTEAIQKQKITELQQKNKLLALNSMIEGQEAERLRIAKDLHDSLGGLLSTVKAHFTSIQNEITQLEQLNLTETTNSLIDEACIEVRRISHNMMPHALSISGLEGALEDITSNLREEGYEATLEISKIPPLETTKEVMIYRLLQEIISNIRKHAQAKAILIQLMGHQNVLHIMVEDDGVGFNYDAVANKGGLGLKSINSRVQFLDGTIDWDSQVGSGTTISINLPTHD